MRAFYLLFAAISSQNVLSSPHRHLHNHHHAARHVKREDDSPVTTWVTEWVSVLKTVEVTTTMWVTPSVPEPTHVKNVNHDVTTEIPVDDAVVPSPAPAQFFEPHPTPLTESSPDLKDDMNLEATPSSAISFNNDKVELPQTQNEVVKETIAPLTVDDEHDSMISNDTKTALVDHAASAGQCTSGSPCNGDITYYDPGVGSGACGWKNTKDEPVVALPHAFMGEKSNGNPYCGKTITIVHNGKTSTARVVDKCMGCTGFSIDLSDSVFSQFEALSVGRTSAKWWINN
ncbi:hypothetical protein HI914_03453 [Erysiphe necator]|uniref:Putative rare lipoprotein a-like double-psi beta-barrel domain-containing n=1 Tax=Uncinula necator TaxID=52586 RepID=A0A0B1P360_UNCNE|nr:hypothetical protein HI914_03453 [Erysiphe necator]KHJ32713.1 putative rare lipoprotein a -like double-psi beta-barrel domain-containing [Erysiphe necator]